MERGIYTLANDNVYDQLVALLNSIEANYSKEIPVCVIPYDDNIEKVASEISSRKNTTLFSDKASIARWEGFARQVWKMHPKAMSTWRERGVADVYRMGMHRRFCSFDGPFDKFVFLDADTIVMKPLTAILSKLDSYGIVAYDYQHKDPTHVFDMNSKNVYLVFSEERIDSEIFCAGFFASRKDLINNEKREQIISKLRGRDVEILYINGPDQSLLNYMIMGLNIPLYNFGKSLSFEERTGNSVTSGHFEERAGYLYDKGNLLTYLHYIGISSAVFRQVCSGENIDFPYRDIFLHYRYLREPEKRPVFRGKPKPYNRAPGLVQRIWRKFVA